MAHDPGKFYGGPPEPPYRGHDYDDPDVMAEQETVERQPFLDAHTDVSEAIENCYRSLQALERRIDPALLPEQSSPTLASEDRPAMKPDPTSLVVSATKETKDRVRLLALRIQQLTARVDI